jgi:hypothetical protein
MGSIGWVAVGVAVWTALSVPFALLVGALARVGARRPAPGRPAPARAAAWERHAAPCAAARRVPAA